VNIIYKTRDAANFKRRHKSPDRETTLMDLQTRFTPRGSDTLRSFYDSSLNEEARHTFSKMAQNKVENLTSEERHRFNMQEGCMEYRGTLRDNGVLLHPTSESVRNRLWMTKPMTTSFGSRKPILF